MRKNCRVRNPKLWWNCFLLLTIVATPMSQAQRLIQSLDGMWKFQQAQTANDTSPNFDDSKFETVGVPHSWPEEGRQLPGGGTRGKGTYRKTFRVAAGWKNKRIILHFEAVSLTAKVVLNGHDVGEHRGGFAAFNLDVTDAIRWDGPNVLAVHVSNESDPDLSPLGGDFNIYGGIYRPVSLWALNPVHIHVLDYGSPGVFLTQSGLNTQQAAVDLRSELANDASTPAPITIVSTVLDRARHIVASAKQALTLAPNAITENTLHLQIPHPHRWDGVADPYLYTVRVDVVQQGHLLDRVVQPLGLRTESFDRDRGFVLNGKAMQIHGVCLHQEGATRGWAVTPADEQRDMQLIRSMGANGIRLAHYQHSQSFLDLADRAGMLVWAELAQVDRVSASSSYRENIRQQLKELIRQNYNHPSIFVWSLFNELNSPTKDTAVPLALELNTLAHSEDPTRPTSGAGSSDTLQHLRPMMEGLDLVAFNDYPGWYTGQPSDLGGTLEKWNDVFQQRGLALTEYGAGASIHDHLLDAVKDDVQVRGRFHPEEWQAIVHEGDYAEIRKRPFVWGAFIWNMFDFSSEHRHEGDTPGMNDKGLVTRDRRIRKDAYFFYQANWTSAPMAHLVGCGTNSMKGSAVVLRAYSNQTSLSLTVNGRPYGIVGGSETHVFLWPGVALHPGANEIVVSAPGGIRDRCSIAIVPRPSVTDSTKH